jgi:HAD superfamily hydrolase (TIGR01509 family)
MSEKFSVIVFDLGNVLLPFDYQRAVDKLNKVEKGLGEHFLKFYDANYEYHRAFERGDMSDREFTETMLSAIDHKIDEETFRKLYSDIFIENKEVVDLLPILKKNYTLVMLSNTNIIHYMYGWKDYDFIKEFDKLVVSYEAGANKPEEKIYRVVESFTGENSDRHFFIDDIAEYVEAAEKLGWEGIQFKGYRPLVTELINRGILTYRD